MRHVLQISGPLDSLAALCDDGTLWAYDADKKSWAALPPIPGQPGTEEAQEAMLLHDRVAVERQERAEQARRDRFQGKP